jgi:peptidyl-prolyl cis-trans isomerase B (cyclophilin B)
MKKFLSALAAPFLALILCCPAKAADQAYVKLNTSKGDITLEINKAKAPVTAQNFLKNVQDGYYDGLIFHRVISGFMIQAGGMDKDMHPKATKPSIKNEADNGLKNQAYTVAMARTSDPDSASTQFFINVADNKALDFASKTQEGWGYAVFGKVVKGQEVVDAIKAVPTTTKGMYRDVPVDPVVIVKAQVVDKP